MTMSDVDAIERRAARRRDFQAKNENRRRARVKSPSNYRRARQARKRLARNGAFGNFAHDSHEYEVCAFGTVNRRDEEDA